MTFIGASFGNTVYVFVFHASIAIAIFGYYIANLLSSLALGVVLHNEPVDRPTVLAFAFSIAATTIIAFSQTGMHQTNQSVGFVLAICSGIAATAIAQEQKRLAPNIDGETITLAQVVGGVLVAVIAMLIAGDHSITHLPGTGVGLGLLYGFFFFACNRLMVTSLPTSQDESLIAL